MAPGRRRPATLRRLMLDDESEQVAERDALWYARLTLRLCQIVYYGVLAKSLLL